MEGVLLCFEYGFYGHYYFVGYSSMLDRLFMFALRLSKYDKAKRLRKGCPSGLSSFSGCHAREVSSDDVIMFKQDDLGLLSHVHSIL